MFNMLCTSIDVSPIHCGTTALNMYCSKILGHRCVWITNFKCWQKAYVELRKFEYVELHKFEYVESRKFTYVELRKFRDIEVRYEHITEFCMY